MQENKVIDSINNSWMALISLIKTLYKEMPALMIIFTLLMFYIAEKIGSNTSLQIGMLTAVIFLCSIAVYIKSKNYGEAVLALSAGLFTVYTVSWITSLFISFIAIWVMFTVVVFLTSSIKLSSTVQSIYMEASFASKHLNLSEKECEKQFQKISNSVEGCIIGPVEIAEIIRLFAFRKISLSDMKTGLKWVNILFSLTRIPCLILANFVAAIIKNASILNQITSDSIFEYIYSGMRNSPVTPQEYIDMFQQTRHLLIKHKDAVKYFEVLNKYFDSGTSPNDIEMYFSKVLHTN